MLRIYIQYPDKNLTALRARGQEKKKHLKIEHIQRMELLKEKSPGNLIDSDIGTCYGDTVFYKPENERI